MDGYRSDLWNDGYAVDPAVVDTCPTYSSKDCKECHTTAIVCGIVIPLCAIIAALVGYIFMMQQNVASAKSTMSTQGGFNL